MQCLKSLCRWCNVTQRHDWQSWLVKQQAKINEWESTWIMAYSWHSLLPFFHFLSLSYFTELRKPLPEVKRSFTFAARSLVLKCCRRFNLVLGPTTALLTLFCSLARMLHTRLLLQGLRLGWARSSFSQITLLRLRWIIV